MKRIFFIFLAFWMMQTNVRAQELTIKSMASLPMDLSASQYERKDLNGKACALVKVQFAITGAQFEGNVVGTTEYKTGEYWVYMTEGSYMLSVKHPSYVPLSVNFRDYGINGIKSKATYVLTLLMTKVSPKTGGSPLKVSSFFDSGFDRGDFPENVSGLLSTLPARRQGRRSGTLKVYRNLIENQYDQLYTINHEGLINNINIGDVLTVLPEDESYQSLCITITDSILKSNEIKCVIQKKKSSLRGHVIDDYANKPVQKCIVSLYVGNYADYGGNSMGLYSNYGYRRYYESGESFGQYLTEKDGYFGWKDCVMDYTYYVSAKPPRGYARIGFNEGVNIKPKDNENDSLTIRIKPVVVKGYVRDGEKAISDVEIECETLYGKKVTTTGQDGSFEIIGPTSEFIRFMHNDFRVMNVKFDDYFLFRDEEINITIKMKRGNRKTPFKGTYIWGKIKEIK